MRDSNDRRGLIMKRIDLFVALLFALAHHTPILLSSYLRFGLTRVSFIFMQLLNWSRLHASHMLARVNIFYDSR